MSALLLFSVAFSFFVLGVLACAVYLSLWPGQVRTVEVERRQDERRLQRMAHAAIVQMLAETRQAQRDANK